jgi:hypothetical protein
VHHHHHPTSAVIQQAVVSHGHVQPTAPVQTVYRLCYTSSPSIRKPGMAEVAKALQKLVHRRTSLAGVISSWLVVAQDEDGAQHCQKLAMCFITLMVKLGVLLNAGTSGSEQGVEECRARAPALHSG